MGSESFLNLRFTMSEAMKPSGFLFRMRPSCPMLENVALLSERDTPCVELPSSICGPVVQALPGVMPANVALFIVSEPPPEIVAFFADATNNVQAEEIVRLFAVKDIEEFVWSPDIVRP